MPKHGQPWNPDLSALAPFDSVLGGLLEPWSGVARFPEPQELGAWVEHERRRRAPELEPLRFVETPPLSRRARKARQGPDVEYDTRIAVFHEVPCLPRSYHDLFNALAFAAFPSAKRALHRRQHRALAHRPPGPGQRTTERDVLTLFDEAGAVVLVPDSLRASWTRSGFHVDLRSAPPPPVHVVLFGHGLWERLQQGHDELRVSACLFWQTELPPVSDVLPSVDAWVAERLEDPLEFTCHRADAIVDWHRNERFVVRPADAVRRSALRQRGSPTMAPPTAENEHTASLP